MTSNAVCIDLHYCWDHFVVCNHLTVAIRNCLCGEKKCPVLSMLTLGGMLAFPWQHLLYFRSYNPAPDSVQAHSLELLLSEGAAPELCILQSGDLAFSLGVSLLKDAFP